MNPLHGEFCSCDDCWEFCCGDDDCERCCDEGAFDRDELGIDPDEDYELYEGDPCQTS